MWNGFKRFLDDFGPLLAGFQIATAIVGFFGIGAVAKWILEHWLPFTRWIWTEILALIKLPDISAEEKDALTTLAFFAPMAISSLVSWWTKRQGSLQPSASDTDPAKEMRLRAYATVIGAVFIVIVGGSVIQDAIALFTTDTSTAGDAEKSFFDVETFARIGLLATTLAGIAMVSISIILVFTRLKNFRTRSRSNLPDRYSIAASGAAVMSTFVSFISMSGGIVIAAGELGLIRTIAPILERIPIVCDRNARSISLFRRIFLSIR